MKYEEYNTKNKTRKNTTQKYTTRKIHTWKYNTKNNIRGNKTQKYNTKIQQENMQHEKYNTHVQREVELSSPEISIMEKVPMQKSVMIWLITFQNDDPLNAHLNNTGKKIAALQPTPP